MVSNRPDLTFPQAISCTFSLYINKWCVNNKGVFVFCLFVGFVVVVDGVGFFLFVCFGYFFHLIVCAFVLVCV